MHQGTDAPSYDSFTFAPSASQDPELSDTSVPTAATTITDEDDVSEENVDSPTLVSFPPPVGGNNVSNPDSITDSPPDDYSWDDFPSPPSEESHETREMPPLPLPDIPMHEPPPDVPTTGWSEPLQDTRNKEERNDRDCDHGIIEWLECNLRIILLIVFACTLLCTFIAGLYVFFRAHDPGSQQDDDEELLMITDSKSSEESPPNDSPFQVGEYNVQQVLKSSMLNSVWYDDQLSIRINAPQRAAKQTSRTSRFSSNASLIKVQEARNYWDPFQPALAGRNKSTTCDADDRMGMSTEMTIRSMEYATTAQSLFGPKSKPLKKGRISTASARANRNITSIEYGNEVISEENMNSRNDVSQSSRTYNQLDDEFYHCAEKNVDADAKEN